MSAAVEVADDGTVVDRKRRIKLIVVGDSAVGKTSLLLSYVRGEFPLEHAPTVFDNHAAQCQRAGLNVTLELVDTAGQEAYDRLRPLSYSGCDVVLCCYSTTSRESFERVRTKWAPEVAHFCPGQPILLVGLKTDLRDEVEDPTSTVSPQEGATLANEIRAVAALEASARTRVGLDAVFERALDTVLCERFPELYASSASGAKQQDQATSAVGSRHQRKKKRPCAIL